MFCQHHGSCSRQQDLKGHHQASLVANSSSHMDICWQYRSAHSHFETTCLPCVEETFQLESKQTWVGWFVVAMDTETRLPSLEHSSDQECWYH